MDTQRWHGEEVTEQAPTWEISTPSLLLVSKAVHAEAVAELRRTPYNMTTGWLGTLGGSVDVMPLTTYFNIEHFHFAFTAPLSAIGLAQCRLWGGGYYFIGPDNAHRPGLLKVQSGSKIRRVSFKTDYNSPFVLDMEDPNTVSDLISSMR